MYKSSKEEYVASKGVRRVGQMSWWFLILIVIGLVALASLWILKGGEAVQEFQKVGALISPISSAYAQSLEELAAGGFTPRILIMAGIFLVLGLVYFAGIFKLFFSSNSNQIETASDLVKTLTGFFVGAATGLLG
jgi:hypothetical protein